jgi:hypothetical protein
MEKRKENSRSEMRRKTGEEKNETEMNERAYIYKGRNPSKKS